MDIEKLKRKRQKNVQEQNALLKHGIKQEAIANPIFYPVVKAFLRSKGINLRSAIIYDCEANYPGMPTYFGRVATKDARFFEFEVDVSPDGTIVDSLWQETTHQIEVNPHKPGIGKTEGYLVLEVLKEVCRLQKV